MVFDIPRVLEGFDTAVARLRERHDGRGPGFSIALLHDGQPIRAVHHGHAQLEWQQPLAGSTRFYLVIVLSNAEGFDASASTWSEHVAAAG